MDMLMSAFLIIASVVLAFLVAREIVLWYWKINKMVELLAELVQLNKRIVESLAADRKERETKQASPQAGNREE